MRVVASVLLAAVALVAAGPLTADAAPTPPVAPPASGVLGAVSGVTSALPPIHVTVGQGPGAVDVTVDAGATVRRVLGTTPSTAPTPRTPTPTTSHHPSSHGARAPHSVTIRSRHVVVPAARPARSFRNRAAVSTAKQHRLERHASRAAPIVRADGPLSSPSHAVQSLLRWSLGSDRTMLVLLGVTAVGALAAMVTVLAMGRRPGLRRASVG